MIVHSLSEDRPASPSVTETIVDAVSEAEDCDPLTLPPLWDVIDPEALDDLFAPTRGGHPRAGRATFVYAGYKVTVEVSTEATVAVSLETAEKTSEF
ncbi:HalOD1 output domain-containing protein [Natronorubrum sp. FCH18a]|uniref:HalOD1 output domain-containing protein n=1 Tax=Natronorubrum sp. FCH18a TaxID=3447018 RepID=UPI003F50E1C2